MVSVRTGGVRTLIGVLASAAALAAGPGTSDEYVVNDHLDLTDYAQNGTDIHTFLRIIGSRVICAVDYIRRVLTTFPGVFSGIDEFTIHTARLTNPALDGIFDFAAEARLVAIMHNDIDVPLPKPEQEPNQALQLGELFLHHSQTTINRHPDRFLVGTDEVAPGEARRKVRAWERAHIQEITQ